MVFDVTAPPNYPALPFGFTHVCKMYPVVAGLDGKLMSADHPVHVKDNTFYYTSGDFNAVLVDFSYPLYDERIDLSYYVPAGAGHAKIFWDPEIRTGVAYGYCGFITKTGEGGNYAIQMVYGMAANGAFEAQITMDLPMNDDRTIVFQVLDQVGAVVEYVIGYQLQSYQF